MSQLFKKAAVFTDIHFGAKSNSTYHNEDCLSFVKWAVEKAQAEGCETCLFLGDWHNNRSTLNIVTLNYSLRALEHLNDHFDRVYFIIVTSETFKAWNGRVTCPILRSVMIGSWMATWSLLLGLWVMTTSGFLN
jgi:hypothetical protein